MIKLPNVPKSRSLATPPTDPAVIAFNAWLRRHTKIPARFGVRGNPPSVKMLKWQPKIPTNQIGVFRQIVKAARAAALDPDLYVWRLTRRQHLQRQPSELPDLIGECEIEEQDIKDRAGGIFSFPYQRSLLKHMARFSDGKFRKGKLSVKDYEDALLTDEQSLLDLVFRWSFAERAKLDRVSRQLKPAALIQLWMKRDVYEKCNWESIAQMPKLIEVAREAYAGSMK